MATTPRPDAPPAPAARAGPLRRTVRLFRYDLVGAAVAVTFGCLSLTPSLLPRGWLLQGLVSGISAAIGYGLGVLAVRVVGPVYDGGADVSPHVRWYPFITFWRVSADLAFSIDAPAGHGHSYGAAPAAAWARIAPPDGWTEQRTAALTALFRR